jgi:hypothetical protein
MKFRTPETSKRAIGWPFGALARVAGGPSVLTRHLPVVADAAALAKHPDARGCDHGGKVFEAVAPGLCGRQVLDLGEDCLCFEVAL